MTAKQLTDSILQLAIQGKLVPQDSNDEPASVLLDRIREEKKRLVKEGKLKKKDLEETPINENEIPFEIPESWEWVRLGTICELISGKNYIEADKGTFYIKVSDMNLVENTKVINTSSHFCVCKETDCIPSYSIIFPKRGGAILTGKKRQVKIANVCIDLNTMALHPFCEAIYSYLFLWFSNVDLSKLYDGSAVPQINNKDIAPLLFPLPPLNEQRRIVEKFEKYFPHIEEYGKAYEEEKRLNSQLPEKLKKSILQEAIMGKLGTQDPNDEPASVLLDRIREEKKHLVKAGVLKKKDLVETPVEEAEMPFDIPDNWEWLRIGELFTISSGLGYKKDDLSIQSDKMVRVLRGGNIFFGGWRKNPDDVFISSQFVDNSLFLRKDTFITPAVSSYEHMGKTGLIREDLDDTVVGGFVLMLNPIYHDEALIEYINYVFQSAYYSKYCQSITHKSGQAFYNISRAKMLYGMLPLPPLAEQHRIVEKIEALFAEVDHIES